MVFAHSAVVTGFLEEVGELVVAVVFEVAAGVLLPLVDRWVGNSAAPVRSAEFAEGQCFVAVENSGTCDLPEAQDCRQDIAFRKSPSCLFDILFKCSGGIASNSSVAIILSA